MVIVMWLSVWVCLKIRDPKTIQHAMLVENWWILGPTTLKHTHLTLLWTVHLCLRLHFHHHSQVLQYIVHPYIHSSDTVALILSKKATTYIRLRKTASLHLHLDRVFLWHPKPNRKLIRFNHLVRHLVCPSYRFGTDGWDLDQGQRVSLAKDGRERVGWKVVWQQQKPDMTWTMTGSKKTRLIISLGHCSLGVFGWFC